MGTVGVIENLRRFGYSGNIGIIQQSDNQQAYDLNILTKSNLLE